MPLFFQRLFVSFSKERKSVNSFRKEKRRGEERNESACTNTKEASTASCIQRMIDGYHLADAFKITEQQQHSNSSLCSTKICGITATANANATQEECTSMLMQD